jgi:hypothetical protein
VAGLDASLGTVDGSRIAWVVFTYIMRRYSSHVYDYLAVYTALASDSCCRSWPLLADRACPSPTRCAFQDLMDAPANSSIFLSSVNHFIPGTTVSLPTTSLCVPASRAPFFTYIKLITEVPRASQEPCAIKTGTSFFTRRAATCRSGSSRQPAMPCKTTVVEEPRAAMVCSPQHGCPRTQNVD